MVLHMLMKTDGYRNQRMVRLVWTPFGEIPIKQRRNKTNDMNIFFSDVTMNLREI